MSTISGWIANMRFPLSHQSHFANIQMAKDSLTPPTQTRSSTPPSGSVPKSASFPATSVACCLKTCPMASPTSLATSNMPTQPQHQKPQWLRKVSYLCSLSLVITAVHILLFYKEKTFEWLPTKMLVLLKRHYISDCRAPPPLLSMECSITKLQWPTADLDDTFHAAGNSLAVTKAPNCCIR